MQNGEVTSDSGNRKIVHKENVGIFSKAISYVAKCNNIFE